MRIAWTTDPHLNFVGDAGVEQFISEVRDAQPDAVLVGGDIGEADSFAAYLERIVGALDLPIHFVLGNHDYYKGSISGVHQLARTIHEQSDRLNWLAESGPVWLTDSTALVGHGGWGDARAADFLNSDVMLNDYLLIEELREVNGDRVPLPENILSVELMSLLQSLGDEAADYLRRVLPAALERAEHVMVLMHVPPFRGACWHEGRTSDDNWAPHFTCIAAGDVLLEIMQRHPEQRMTVLCGHTHGSGHAQIRDNLEVFTGDAEYERPKVQRVFDLE